jgi:hypothetical protein
LRTTLLQKEGRVRGQAEQSAKQSGWGWEGAPREANLEDHSVLASGTHLGLCPMLCVPACCILLSSTRRYPTCTHTHNMHSPRSAAHCSPEHPHKDNTLASQTYHLSGSAIQPVTPANTLKLTHIPPTPQNAVPHTSHPSATHVNMSRYATSSRTSPGCSSASSLALSMPLPPGTPDAP